MTCCVSSKYSRRFSSYRAAAKMFTDGRTNGRQAHRYIPRTFRSGDKNAVTCITMLFWISATTIIEEKYLVRLHVALLNSSISLPIICSYRIHWTLPFLVGVQVCKCANKENTKKNDSLKHFKISISRGSFSLTKYYLTRVIALYIRDMLGVFLRLYGHLIQYFSVYKA